MGEEAIFFETPSELRAWLEEHHGTASELWVGCVYSWKIKALVKVAGPLARLVRFADLDDQVEACRRVFASATRWTVVRGSDLEEDESQGLPVWSRHVGDPHPREQQDAPRRLCPLHGGGPRERRAHPRRPGDRRPPDPLGARPRRQRLRRRRSV